MEVNFSRYLKELGRFSTEELTLMFIRSVRSEVDKNEFVNMLKEFVDDSGEMNVAYNKKSKTTTKSRSSKKQIVREVMIKMREKLASYEESDAVDHWEIYFSVGQDYSNVELNEIKDAHKR